MNNNIDAFIFYTIAILHYIFNHKTIEIDQFVLYITAKSETVSANIVQETQEPTVMANISSVDTGTYYKCKQFLTILT